VASPEAKTPYKEPLKKAKTVDELVAMYDYSECVNCHADVAEQWSKSLHARSIFGTGRTIATILTTYKVVLKNFPHARVKDVKDVKVEHLMLCAKCHLPQLAEAEDSGVRLKLCLTQTKI
jgi:hypothetical protein